MSVIQFPLVRAAKHPLLKAIARGRYAGFLEGGGGYAVSAPPVSAYVWVDGTCEIRTSDRLESGYWPEFLAAILERETSNI